MRVKFGIYYMVLFLAQTVGRSLSAGDYIAIRYDFQLVLISELYT